MTSQIDNNAILLGKLLAEVYRVQKKLGLPVDTSHIFALRNGFETAIEEEVERIGYISRAQVKHVADVLEPIWQDPEKLAGFTGFYAIEHELSSGGVDRSAAIRILNYFAAEKQFTEVIAKMDTSNSPSECRTFGIREGDL